MTFESILTYISIHWEKCLWTFVASMLAVIGTEMQLQLTEAQNTFG